MRKNMNTDKTHCKRGHVLSGDNLYVYIDKRDASHRYCKTCRNESARIHVSKKRRREAREKKR